MSIFVIGINHKTAPIALREKVFFAEDKLALYLQDLLQQGLLSEAVLLSTCNRSELYCVADDVLPLIDWFHAQTNVAKEALLATLYCHEALSALLHLSEVAVGLDSMVLGEPQIFGQVKAAFAESSSIGAIGPVFQHVFPHVFRMGKDIRTMTSLGACPVSVASAAIYFLREKLGELADLKVLLVGAGDTIDLLLPYLEQSVKHQLHLVNRSVDKARALASRYPIVLHEWHALSTLLEEVDVVISATGSPKPIITENMVSAAMEKRATKPLSLLDLAVPRDIEPAIVEIPHVSFYCIDDLTAVIAKHRQGREHAASKARDMIKAESIAFMQELSSSEHVSHAIRSYRKQIEAICQIELEKAHQQLLLGVDANAVLTHFARNFTNKLLHTPSVTLRQAGKEGRFELLHFAKQLFAVAE